MTRKKNLEDMLDALRGEKEQIAFRLAVLDAREATLLEWLAEEAPPQPDLLAGNGTNGGTPLSTFLRGILADGRPHSLRELADMTKAKGGLIRGDAMPGRVVHFALLGLSQHGYAKRKDGMWVGR